MEKTRLRLPLVVAISRIRDKRFCCLSFLLNSRCQRLFILEGTCREKKKFHLKLCYLDRASSIGNLSTIECCNDDDDTMAIARNCTSSNGHKSESKCLKNESRSKWIKLSACLSQHTQPTRLNNCKCPMHWATESQAMRHLRNAYKCCNSCKYNTLLALNVFKNAPISAPDESSTDRKKERCDFSQRIGSLRSESLDCFCERYALTGRPQMGLGQAKLSSWKFCKPVDMMQQNAANCCKLHMQDVI